jgi:hypothetical protein
MWRFWRPRRDLNFLEVESLEEAEFLAPPPRLVNDEDRHRHRQALRRFAITKRDEQLMWQWREQFPSDVCDKEDFYATQRAERRADRRRGREFAEQEIDNPNTTLGDDDPRWDDVWTATTSTTSRL